MMTRALCGPKQKRTRDEQEIVPQDAMPVEGSPSMRR